MKNLIFAVALTLFGTTILNAQTAKEVDQYPVFGSCTGDDKAQCSQINVVNYIGNNLKYPKEAAKKGTEGKVFISFTVDKQGKVKDATVKKSVSPLLDAEALRVIKGMQGWKAGKHQGKDVAVQMVMPILFKLKE